MKKFLCIGTTFILALSITACANRNDVANNNQNQTNTQNQLNTTTTRRGATDSDEALGKYNNGIYVGQGNVTTTGSDAAIVTIRNGAIDNIELLMIDATGKIQPTDTPNFSSITEPNALNVPVPNGTASTPNVTTTPGTATVPGTTIAAGTDTGLPNTTTNSIDGNAINNNNNILNNNNTNTTNNANMGNASLASAKKDLINNVLHSQSADVNVNTDDNVKTVVDDWKIAIQDALNKATT